MPWNPVWFLGQEPRTPRVPYGEDTRIHIYLQNLESSIGQYHNYDKSSWHIYDKNDKSICHFLIRLAFVIRCSLAQGGTLARTKDGFPSPTETLGNYTPRIGKKCSGDDVPSREGPNPAPANPRGGVILGRESILLRTGCLTYVADSSKIMCS